MNSLSFLYSGKDQALPSQEEGQRIQKALPDCEIRVFEESGHFLFFVCLSNWVDI